MKKIFLSIIVFCFCVNSNAQEIAGIEVGSKSVKLTVLNKEGEKYTVLKDTSVNTDFISFDEKTKAATLQAFSGLYTFVKNTFSVSSNNIATVISSGVKAQADKAKKNDFIKSLIIDFRKNINEDKKEVEVVSVLNESVLSHYGIVADENRYNTFLIDIGSGNTKGGYFGKLFGYITCWSNYFFKPRRGEMLVENNK
jgi:hypothetical protein